MKKIKNCPYCGNDNQTISTKYDVIAETILTVISCTNQACGFKAQGPTVQTAAERWNEYEKNTD